jgi:hypothetical protein
MKQNIVFDTYRDTIQYNTCFDFIVHQYTFRTNVSYKSHFNLYVFTFAPTGHYVIY